MERKDLERAAARIIYLRGLLAVPTGLFLISIGLGNLEWGPFDQLWVIPVAIVVVGASTVAVMRFYVTHYGSVTLPRDQQVRLTAASLLLFLGSIAAGSTIDTRVDLPISVFAVVFGLGMLAWFALCVGLRPHHLVIWGGLLVVGLLPVWGGFDERGAVGFVPVGVATILAGVFDHLALVRTYGPAKDVHVVA
jgi:hypothetical protein